MIAYIRGPSFQLRGGRQEGGNGGQLVFSLLAFGLADFSGDCKGVKYKY